MIKKSTKCHYYLFTIVMCGLLQTSVAQQISLAGKWRFAMDSNNVGVKEKWYAQQLLEEVMLPGSMAQNGRGNDVSIHTKWVGSIYDSSFFFRPAMAKYRTADNLKIPFWLTPVKHYVGAAWYQREVVVPSNWAGKQVILYIERAHIVTRVWVNGSEVGLHNSLVAPHEFDISKWVKPGKHTITIRVDNSLDQNNVGPDSHSVSDHTQGAWNGMVGKLELQAKPTVFLHDVQVFADFKKQHALVKVWVVNQSLISADGNVSLKAEAYNSKVAHRVLPVHQSVKVFSQDTALVTLTLPMGKGMQLWDEFNPALYRLTATVTTKSGVAKQQLSFGMREIKADGNRILVNGKPVHLRGTLNNCEFPLTGFAPMDVASWRRIFTVAKAHGLNHMRFHSWCPPEAAFVAADEAGFYLQPEGPSWPNHGTSLGDHRFIDNYLYEEAARMLRVYGNHPSFCMLAAGNEPAGKNQAKYLGEFVRHWQQLDNRRIYTGASVGMSWPLVPENDFMVKSGPRGLPWHNTRPESATDYSTSIEKFNVPYITHEMGQWCAFPNFKEIAAYKGVMKPKNFELFQQDLADQGMAQQAQDFLMASGKLQALCYKQEIEKSLRTGNSAGFQLLGLQDFPGQGTALVGVLNALWQNKGYIDAASWRRFCSPTVPLTRIPKFTYSNDEHFSAAVEIYHYGAHDLKNAVVWWQVKNATGEVLQNGTMAAGTISTGGNFKLGTIDVPLISVSKAAQLTLEVGVAGTAIRNDWQFWVYPKQLPTSQHSVHFTDTLDAKAESILAKGGTVFLQAVGKVVKGKEVVQYFTPVFWNTSWFKMRPPHTLGILVDTTSAAFSHFPTSYHSDLQWWEIVNRAQVMHLEDFPKGFKPLVQPIDTWFMNRKLTMLFEAKVGNGKIIVCSADLTTDGTSRVAARQLMYSLQQYMASPKFNPSQQVELSLIRDLFQTPSKQTWDSFTNATPDELRPQLQPKQ